MLGLYGDGSDGRARGRSPSLRGVIVASSFSSCNLSDLSPYSSLFVAPTSHIHEQAPIPSSIKMLLL